MLKVVCRFSKAIQKSANILKQMRDNRHYIHEPFMSQKQEAEKIVEQLYFTPKAQEFKEQENLPLQTDQLINFRKYQTAKELLDLYEQNPLKKPEEFVNWFNQLCYCVKFQSRIQENLRNHHKYLAGKYKAQYNKEYQMPETIFLQPVQIMESPIFTNALVDFVTYTEVDAQVEVRRNLTRTFKTIVYQLDFYVLQRIWEDSYPIQTIQYLSLILKDISEGRFDKNQEIQFLELFEGKIKEGQNLKLTIEQLLQEKMQKIDLKKLNNQDFTDYIFTYYQQQKMPVIHLIDLDDVKQRVSTLTLLQNVKICQTLVALQVGDSQLFTYLLWNIIRLKNQVIDNREAVNGIIFILMHFRQNLFYFKQPKYYSKPILVEDVMIFPEIFKLVSQNINEYSYVQLNQLLIIGYQNFTKKFDAIITALYKCPEAFENVQINHKIDLIYKSTQASSQQLDVSKLLKHKVLQLSSRTVQGFFEKPTTQVEQITVYQPYYTQELNHLVRLLWVSIVQGSKQFEDLNYLIFKINEMTQLNTIIKLDRNIQRQISQINQFIEIRGKKMFPKKIDFQQILNNKLIFRKQEAYPHPLKLHTKLFIKEKQYFSLKYAKDLQKDVLYKDVLFDYVYTNPQTQDQALILLNSQNQYFISEEGDMIPNTQIAFQQSLLDEANIPVVQIDLPDVVNCREKSFYERELKQILGEGSEEFENMIEKINTLRTALVKDFNYVQTEIPKEEEQEQEDKYDIDD